jgi:hypothetical protein
MHLWYKSLLELARLPDFFFLVSVLHTTCSVITGTYQMLRLIVRLSRCFPKPINPKRGNFTHSQNITNDLLGFGSNLKINDYVFISFSMAKY